MYCTLNVRFTVHKTHYMRVSRSKSKSGSSSHTGGSKQGRAALLYSMLGTTEVKSVTVSSLSSLNILLSINSPLLSFGVTGLTD